LIDKYHSSGVNGKAPGLLHTLTPYTVLLPIDTMFTPYSYSKDLVDGLSWGGQSWGQRVLAHLICGCQFGETRKLAYIMYYFGVSLKSQS
jgi:hypothetical protein